MLCTSCLARPGPARGKRQSQTAPGRGDTTRGLPSTSAPFAFPRAGRLLRSPCPAQKNFGELPRAELSSARPFKGR